MRILALLPAALVAPLLLASCGLVHLPDECPTANPLTIGAPPGCPCEPPNPGTSCDLAPTFEGAPNCTYGTDELPACRQHFWCIQSTWQSPEGPAETCPSTEGCPSTPPVHGAACAGQPPTCGFHDGTICTCTFQGWSCSEPTPGPACPTFIPNAGTPCSTDAFCSYGSCNATCGDGVWKWSSASGC